MNIIDMNFSFKSNHTSRSLSVIDRIILHHAAAKNCSAEDIHRWHQDRGFAGFGYNFLVRKNGLIYAGRPVDWVGAHCTNYNTVSIGVCFEGDYEQETEMPEAQKQAGKELVAFLKQKYNISKVYKHKDLQATDCPGKYFPFDEIANATGSSNVTVSQPTQSSSTLLKKGSKGDKVKEAQNKLIAKGYSCGSCGADGIFGAATEQAVRQLQADAKIAVDGIIGNDTWSILNSSFSRGVKTSYPGTLIRKGQKSEDVRKVQSRLQAVGISVGRFGVDGNFGNDTENAVKEFQRRNGLAVDGIVGPKTWNKLFN